MKEQASSQQTLLHAIDLALLRDWGQAKALAESIDSPIGERLFLLLATIEEREAARLRHLANVRHEVGNALSIAQANIEAIVDGLLEPSEERLNALLAALGTASTVLDNLRRADVSVDGNAPATVEEIDLSALVDAHVASLQRFAASKDVTLRHNCIETHRVKLIRRGDGAHVGRILQEALLAAIRSTPPRGVVDVSCARDGSTISLRVDDHVNVMQLSHLSAILKSAGGTVRSEADQNGHHSIVVGLPLEPQKLQP